MQYQPFHLDTDIEQVFIDTIANIEQKTGKLYQMILQEQGTPTNSDRIIKPFKNRSPIIIYDMDSEYTDLNGTYQNYEEIKDQLDRLYPHFALDIKEDPENPKSYLWKCPKCETYGGGEGRTTNSSWSGCCQRKGCNYSCHSKYENVKVNLHYGQVFKSGGGGISISNPIGKVKIGE